MALTMRLALFGLLLLCSCSHFQLVKLQNFHAAVALPQQSAEVPPVFRASVLPDSLPEAVPFAVVLGDFSGGDPNWYADLLRYEAADEDLHPDFLIYHDGGVRSGGAIVQPGGFYAQSIERPQARATCYRITPARLGIRRDANNMVVDIAPETRSSGILEGDTLVAVAGASMRGEPTEAPYILQALRLRPGESVIVEWIRPGVGKMQGNVVMLPSLPIAPGLPAMRPAVREPANDSQAIDK